jgi:hypothetical protein
MTEAEHTAFAREKGSFNECHTELRKMSNHLAGELANPRMERFNADEVVKTIEALDFISHRMQRAAQGFTTWSEARDAIWEAGYKPAWKEREEELVRPRIQAPSRIDIMPVGFPADQLPDLGPEFKVLGDNLGRIIKMGKAS